MAVTVVVSPARRSCLYRGIQVSRKTYAQHAIAIESRTGDATELADATRGGGKTSAKVAMCVRKYLSDRVSTPNFPRGAGYSKPALDMYPDGDIRNNFWTDIGYELAKKWSDTYPLQYPLFFRFLKIHMKPV